MPAAKTKTTEQLEAIEKYLSKANTKQIVSHHHGSPVISSLVQILFEFFIFILSINGPCFGSRLIPASRGLLHMQYLVFLILNAV